MMAERMGLCNNKTVKRIHGAVSAYNLYQIPKYDSTDFSHVMISDKKNTDSRITFEFPTILGNCVEKKLTVDEVREIIQYCLNNL